ncbi:MAG: hypothetical protein ACRDZ3_03670 [Acidimicrobiia bacterium]
MRRILVALMASSAVIGLATPAHAGSYGPGSGYTAGPQSGDSFTSHSASPQTGVVSILQHNSRQAAAVHCIGDGPRATLKVSQPVEGAVTSVTVEYAEAFMTEHPVIDVLVRGTQSGWQGHGAALGPKNGEAGSINVPLQGDPLVVGEALEVIFGLQVHAGCLPHPTMLGLMGSRAVEGGRVVFPSVTVS